MPTALARLFKTIWEELRSPVAPFPVDHVRTRLVALFLYLSNGLALAYEVFYADASPLSIWLSILSIVLAVGMTASEFATERLGVPYRNWIRPLFFLQIAFVAPLRYMVDPTSIHECLLLAGVLIYFIHGVDVRVCAGDITVGCVIAYVAMKLFGYQIDSVAFIFVMLVSGIAGLLVMAKEVHLRRERMRTMRTLIGVMAHELRTPLATISASADLMEPALKESAEASRTEALMQRLRGSVSYMHAIIDHQIANSGVASTKGETQLFDLGDLVRVVHEEFPYRQDAERYAVLLDIQPRVMMRCSQTIMRQVITNLHKNAITAVAKTNREFRLGDISLRVSSRGKDVVLEVEDLGVGIDSRDLSRIFDPFFSATPKASHGLGLTQVREAVHFMGGELEVKSKLGQGTRFIARFPAQIA